MHMKTYNNIRNDKQNSVERYIDAPLAGGASLGEDKYFGGSRSVKMWVKII